MLFLLSCLLIKTALMAFGSCTEALPARHSQSEIVSETCDYFFQGTNDSAKVIYCGVCVAASG